MSNDTLPKKRHKALVLFPLVWLVLLIITLVSLFFSAWLICLGNLLVKVFGLLLGGASLYPLTTTNGFTHWNALTTEKKVAISILIIVEILWICVVVGRIYAFDSAVGFGD